MQDKLDLLDLRLVTALLREGGLAQAARALGVNHSTAFRRLGALEERLGEELFDRRGGRYEPTALAALLAESAERMEAEMLTLERRLAGKGGRIEGSVRITAPDDIAQELLPGPLAVLRERHPDLHLELAIDNRFLSLTHREADIALRPTPAPDESLVGRVISPLASGLYCARSRAGEWRGAPEAAPWIAWEKDSGPAYFGQFRDQRWPGATVVYRTSSMLHQARAAAEGLGLALLPCFLGEADPRLIALEKPLAPLESKLWLLTHADLRSAPRIRACLDLLYEELKRARGRLMP
jgi:DNA-binding transcriptional LysR family regulator